MTNWKPWATGMVAGVAATVKARRTAMGLTAAELAELTSVGKPLSRAVISDLETGRKKTLDIVELITLAEALRCSPLSLLFPNAMDDCEELPGKMEPARQVLRMWVDYDTSIRVALTLARVERQLERGRTHLERTERYNPDDDHSRLRAELELLEADRVRLTEAYRSEVEEQWPDA